MLIDCRCGGLHGVEYASFTQEQVGSLPDAPSGGYDLMYRLKIRASTHSAQVQSRPQCFRRECRRVLHGAHAVALTHEQSITVQRTSLSRAPANYTERHAFVQRRRQQGQRTHGTAPTHTVQFFNTFSLLSDPAPAHLPHPQRPEAPPAAPSQPGPVSTTHVPGATQAAALGRPHAARTRHARSHIYDCDYIGTLNTRYLNTCSMTEVRVGALSQLMQTHCIGVMAVQETRLAGHLREFDVFGIQYMGPPAPLQHGVPTGGTRFFVRDAIDIVEPLRTLAPGHSPAIDRRQNLPRYGSKCLGPLPNRTFTWPLCSCLAQVVPENNTLTHFWISRTTLNITLPTPARYTSPRTSTHTWAVSHLQQSRRTFAWSLPCTARRP